jgi:hypothetical protein
VPFSALYLLLTLFIVFGISIFAFKRRGLKRALIFSLLGLGIFAAIFVVFLTVTLNNT